MIPNNTPTTIVFNSEVTDTLSEYDPATGIFTAKINANLRVDSSIRLQEQGAATSALSIQRALAATPSTFVTIFEQNTFTPAAYSAIPVSGSVKVTVGDKIRIQFTHNQGTNRTLDSSPAYNIYLSISA